MEKRFQSNRITPLAALGLVGALAASAGLMATSCGSGSHDDSGSAVQDFTQTQLYGGSLPSKTLALTFDDGLGARSLELARYLKSEGILAAFFVNGSMGMNTPANLKAIAEMGHLLANHRHTHVEMALDDASIQGVQNTDAKISPYVPGKAFLFRAPFGYWPAGVANFLNAAGLRKYVGSVLWDVGGALTDRYSADWECWSRGLSLTNCGQGYLDEIADKGRGIVLLHDIHSPTVDMVKWMVPRLKKDGYTFVRLDTVPTIAQKIREAGGTPGLGAGGITSAQPGLALIKVANTWIKRSPAQSDTLPAWDKCLVTDRTTVLSYTGRQAAEANHMKLDLKFADATCPAFTGAVYVYSDHWTFRDE